MKKEELIKKYMNNELCIKRNGASEDDLDKVRSILDYNYGVSYEYEWNSDCDDYNKPEGMQVITVQDFLKACEETEDHWLIKEAQKRYKRGMTIIPAHCPDSEPIYLHELDGFNYEDGYVCAYFNHKDCVFLSGEFNRVVYDPSYGWAKIVDSNKSETDKEEDYSHLIGKEVEVRDVDDEEWNPKTFLGALKMKDGSTRYFVSFGDNDSVSYEQMREKQETIHLEKGDYTKEELETELNKFKNK